MSKKFPLIVAIFIGVAALFAIKSYLNKMQLAAQSQLKGTRVVAARNDIAEGTMLTRDLIIFQEVPDRFIPNQALRYGSEENMILGRKTRFPIRAKHLILISDFEEERPGGLSAVIPADYGAFTVAIAKGVKPGLIQPNDHIDVLGSFAIPKSPQPVPATSAAWRQGAGMVNVVLLQNVTVLAVGDTIAGPGKMEGATGSDVTLALKLPEAQLLMFAAEHGELGAMLRRHGVGEIQERKDLPRVTFEEIDKIIGDLDGRRNLRPVEVLKGSKSITVPVNSN